MLFKSLFLILSYECVPVTRLVEPVLVIDTGLARLDFAYLAHPPLLTSTLGQRALLDTKLFQDHNDDLAGAGISGWKRCRVRTVICDTYNSALG